jgi:hypothetical protein
MQINVFYPTSTATASAPSSLATSDADLAQKLANPVSVGAGARYYVESPDAGPEWGLRVSLTILLPK